MRILVLILCLVAGCASPVRKMTEGVKRVRLFPDGVYRHQVSLKLPDGSTREFDGVVSVSPKAITVVGLSGFATTIFRIEEDRPSAAVKTTIYLAPMKKHEAQIERFYKVLRKMMLLPMGAPDQNRFDDVDVRFSNYDDNHVPDRIEMHNPKFEVSVRTVGYEA